MNCHLFYLFAHFNLDLGSSFWGMAMILASTNLLTARIAAGCLGLALLVVLFIAKNVRKKWARNKSTLHYFSLSVSIDEFQILTSLLYFWQWTLRGLCVGKCSHDLFVGIEVYIKPLLLLLILTFTNWIPQDLLFSLRSFGFYKKRLQFAYFAMLFFSLVYIIACNSCPVL